MVTWRLVASAAVVLLVVLYAVGSGIWVSANPGWYAVLVRPSWQPPDVVFALIWPTSRTGRESNGGDGLSRWGLEYLRTALTD